ncbi:twin-arginine translocase subunit TatC [Nocardioides lentus]|uniref:Sec-independent protein translocase protein TatC n=1 Tax=Nocardioides lentus TaxID=338077 RepID=A0ABP5B6T5_9ACTN
MTTASVARGTMPLVDHLAEARRRGVRAAAAVLVGIALGFWLADDVLDVLRAPVEQIARDRAASLNYDTVTGAFDLRMRIAVMAGLVLSSPVWAREVFAFLAPGLTRRERLHALGFGLAAVPLFAGGCAFGLALFPHMVELLAGFSAAEDTTILTATYYVDFVLTLVVAIGIAFVLPVVVVMLNVLGLAPAASIRRSWRLIVVVITLFSALVTPAADLLSMFLVAAPMAGLFGVAVLVTHVHDARAARRALPGPDPAPSLS